MMTDLLNLLKKLEVIDEKLEWRVFMSYPVYKSKKFA
jgi:hypothetical protein